MTRRVTLLMETGFFHDFGNFSTRGEKYYFRVEGAREMRLKQKSKPTSQLGPDWVRGVGLDCRAGGAGARFRRRGRGYSVARNSINELPKWNSSLLDIFLFVSKNTFS